uniref:Zeta-crystallin n=2 Tax=Caligus rogercresseyi TaxID=217165 RepID=C1BQP9_CALRO|nr:Zeta-crystallin [Caligus rogercresseyi]
MRAVLVKQFGGPEVLQLIRNRALPGGSLDVDQVLIRVFKAGVNPVDTYIREGKHVYVPELPYVPGNDAAGIIEALGPQIQRTGLKVRDRVFVIGRKRHSGASAEYLISNSCNVIPLDPGLSFSQGAAIGIPYFTAYRALVILAQAKPHETVLIHGASGSVGIAAIQIAKSFGMRVVGSAGSSEGLQLVMDVGAGAVFNHNQVSSYSRMKEVLGDVNFKGFDVIIENHSNMNLQKDLNMIRRGARIMIVGCRGNVEINPRLLMFPEAKIMGVAVTTSTEEEWELMERALTQGFKNKVLRPIIDREYHLENIGDAHKDIIESKGAKGKLILSLVDETEAPNSKN